ncbi:MAG: radical SAM protein [Candidatus Methanomethylophilaceae archaeon]|nr:radical SAM protein [Candidatus Methanomethylophilaceae archaeon]MDD2779535.1 radical SAM protein [Candidatus Methanomethylophilaceae archaeon]MDD3127844.1 radical SAM protein [Candidatus Methanomethylophilaceae archaeon]MDD4119524.1 radical SAM protein [Candidatus Methanomethylophilaceae archaeon]MDD4453864.1 radical SAM protein [Candidatus Methanomethylophilaceae archaeon]
MECRRALSPSKLPDMDYALNPYSGCAHGCVYCYAPEVTHSEWEGWRIPKAKMNIARRLSLELPNIKGIIGIGTVTDPYQPVESELGLTLQCLRVLKERDIRIHMHTKSDLILRDIDLLSEMECTVGITITGIEERESKMTEPGAPMPSRRLEAIAELADAGIDVYALVGPVLNHLEGREGAFVDAVVGTGVKLIYIDSLNPRPFLSERLARMRFSSSPSAERRIKELAEAAGVEVRPVFL